MLPNENENNRRQNRLNLSLPVRIEHKANKEIAINEITHLIDVSAFGAGFNLQHPIKRGRLVFMTMPLSMQLRNYDFSEPQYRIWGLVRHCIQVRRKVNETYAIGTAFIGKHPPSGYFDDPSKLYDITEQNGDGFWNLTNAPAIPDESDLPVSDRRHTRYPIPLEITLEVLDENGDAIMQEITVTENISLGGASVFSSIEADVGSFLRLTNNQYNTMITSIVRGKRLGADGIPRLHLEFFDRYFPLEGIE